MSEEDSYGTWCAISSDLNKAITTLHEIGVKPDVIQRELHEIIERILICKLEVVNGDGL